MLVEEVAGRLISRGLLMVVEKRKASETAHLMRRDLISSAIENNPPDGTIPVKIHHKAFAGFMVLAVIGFVIVVLVQYTVKLMMTLVVVEEPQAVYLPLDAENEALCPPPTPRLVRNGEERQFITTSIRGTLRHLRKEAGPYAPWRGFGANVCFALANGLIRGVVVAVLFTIFPMWMASSIGGIISMLLVSRFALAVTHIMISVPQPGKSWYHRILDTPWSSAVKTIPALLIFSVCLQFVTELCRIISQESFSLPVRLSSLFAVLIAYIFLVVPATILLVRVQASTLPDDIQTIVPFDRTFGQDISLTNDALTVKGALESLNWPVMKRTLGFMAKTIPVVFMMTGTYVMVLALLWVFAVVDNPTA